VIRREKAEEMAEVLVVVAVVGVIALYEAWKTESPPPQEPKMPGPPLSGIVGHAIGLTPTAPIATIPVAKKVPASPVDPPPFKIVTVPDPDHVFRPAQAPPPAPAAAPPAQTGNDWLSKLQHGIDKTVANISAQAQGH
jgi:hypothetical protein